MRKFIISEEQYRYIVEGNETHITANAKPGDDTKQVVQNAVDNAATNGLNPDNVVVDVKGDAVGLDSNTTVYVPGKNVKPSDNITGESKIITIKELKENRLKKLKENSVYFPLNEFIKTLKK